LIENLQDHINSRFSFESIERHTFADWASARKEYQETRTGPLADHAVYTFANMPLMQFLSSEEQANLQILLESYNKEVSLTGNVLTSITVWRATLRGEPNCRYFTFQSS
jgi:hypothetical protein